MRVFWVITLWAMIRSFRRFGGTCSLSHQGDWICCRWMLKHQHEERPVTSGDVTTQKSVIWATLAVKAPKLIWARNSLLLWHQTVNHRVHKSNSLGSIPSQFNPQWQENPRNMEFMCYVDWISNVCDWLQSLSEIHLSEASHYSS